jgi:hypothetical protein
MHSVSLSLESRVVQQSDIIPASMGDHLMMMDIEQGCYYDLNPTARFIWQALETPRQIRELCLLIQEEFDVSEAQCIKTVMSFVDRLLLEKVVSLVREPGC